MTQKTALITGITGQDGSYLAEFLLEKKYRVVGFQQLSATDNTDNITHILNDIELIYGDMTDGANINRTIMENQPDEIYNLAGQSHVGESFHLPELTAQINAIGVLKFLEGIKLLKPNTKFYQASTSEIFGNNPHLPLNETTPLRAESPYAAAKIYAHQMVDIYRKSYGLLACCGILFNHESPRRGIDFVTRKVTKAIGNGEVLELGNLNAKRDWGHARDFVRGMWMMMQTDNPDDYILATGQSHSVREFVTSAYAHSGITLEWQGADDNEIGINKITKDILVKINPNHYRPNDIHDLIGDASKAKKILRWQPETSFETLVKEMVENDLGFVRHQKSA